MVKHCARVAVPGIAVPAIVALAIVALGIVGPGCRPREVTWERDGIRYIKRVDDTTVTADVLDDLSRHRDVIGAYLHLKQPPHSILTYRKYLDRDDLRQRSHCSEASAGCYFDQFGVESKARLDAHELIHAYTAYLGTKPKIVEEGLAQALSCEGPTIGSIEIPVTMGWSRAAWQSPFYRDLDALYRAGAAFVAYTLQSYGAERFMAFYTKLGAEDELGVAATKFEQVFGSSLAESWSAALANRDADRSCVYPAHCAEPPFSTAHATYRSDGLSLLSVVPQQTGSFEWRFGACDTSPLHDVDLDRSGDGMLRAAQIDVALGEGRFWFRRESVARTVRPLGDVLGTEETCQSLEPLAVNGDDRLVAVSRESLGRLAKRLHRTPGDSTWTLRAKLESPGGRVRVECSANVSVEICESCDYTSCQLACETGKTSVAIGDPATVSRDPVTRMHLSNDAGFWVRLRRDEQRTSDSTVRSDN